MLACAACGESPYIELQIADTVLPFLAAEDDFDQLRVDARAAGCADTSFRIAASPLPATATILAGDCYTGEISLSAAASLGERDVARSSWLVARFPEAGAAVVTATLTDVPGRRTLFSTGFEESEGPLALPWRRGVVDASARVTTEGALTGERSAWMTGTATGAAARLLARVAVTNVALARGDELVLTLEIAAGSEVAHVGVELELASGATAASLQLRDRAGRAVAPNDASGRRIGEREQWVIDLSPAADDRLVGVLVGAEPGANVGAISVRADDVSIVRP